MKEKDLNRSKLFIYVLLEEICYVERKYMQNRIHHERDQVKEKKKWSLMRSRSTVSRL